ncbi:MAG: hypothetical protein ACTS73_07230 [Arsenophonus sp. NEOnobi-MAG3]
MCCSHVRETLNKTIDHKQALKIDDPLSLPFSILKALLHSWYKSKKTVTCTQKEVLLALLLAANWYDNMARETHITS